ncbi:MAG: type II CAAX endopeptidase family protein [Eubacteriales bacterium]|nr:type II CAAX endopeptidase family protein [Eubacteriales bacterium]
MENMEIQKNNSWTGQEKRQLVIFALIAYVLPYVLGLLMWYGVKQEMDLSVFPNAQMFYPAAGVMLAVLLMKKDHLLVPKRFFGFYLVLTIIMAAMAVASIFLQSVPWASIISLPIIVGSVAGWVFLLTEKKEKREQSGLRWKNTKASIFCIVLFLVLYFLRYGIAVVISGETEALTSLVSNPVTWINFFALFINFFLVFIAFFGEEYGWRYYLTPMLQKRYGKRIGVILLGILWGLWHLPIDFFYYTTTTGLQMAAAQQITCITLGIFFAYTYMKTENIWVPVILHMLNNNLIPIFSQNYSADILENQVVGWGDLLPSLLMNGLLFGIFLLAKVYRKEAEKNKN